MGTNLRRDVATQQQQAQPASAAPEREHPAPALPAPVGTLVVGHAADPAEAAADRLADSALARLQGLGAGQAATPHRHRPGCDHVARSVAAPSGSTAVGFEGGALDAPTSDRINSRRGGGSALPDGVRHRMESGFGRSFSGVRIHTDGAAADLNTAVSARAFTTGNDIFFGRGTYDPASATGERVLAHELAHTTQTAGPVHRLFGLGKKLTPEEQQKKDEAEAAKKQAKKDAERELKEKKKTAAENKKLEKSEKADLKKQRKEGDAERTKIAQKIGEESTKTESGATLQKIQGQFAARLVMEKELCTQLITNGATEEEAYEQAYRETWRENCPQELAALRPPRETAAERLASAVREARLESRMEEQQAERGKLGTMLSKKVEEVYEQWELETLRLREEFPKMDAREADYQAGKTVWGQTTEEIRKKRPTDPVLERKARMEAHTRLTLGNRLPKEKPSTIDTALEGTETAASTTGAVLKVDKLPQTILGKIGKDKDKGIRDTLNGLTGTEGAPKKTLAESLTGQFGTANYQLRTDQRKLAPKTPLSQEAKASQGIGTVTSIINDLFSSVTGVMKIVKAIGEMREGGVDARKALTLTKACSDGAKTGVSLAKDAADLAKLIDPGVASAVGSVIPGFSIATSALSIISSATTVADTGMRVSDNRDRLLEARARPGSGAKKVDVMVWPLLHVESALAKTLANNVFATSKAVVDLAASIAEVASAGGFGIPAAVKAANNLLSLLNSVAHTIADQIIAKQAKDAREDAIGRGEGTAETQLQKDPAMVVDGIIVRARKSKDAVAIKFLESYGIDDKRLANAPMGELRSTVLGALGESADPKYIWESYYDKFKGLVAKVKGVGTKFGETGELAKDRNALDGKPGKRGVGWRLKMMFKGEAKFTRSKSKTLAQKEGESDIEVRVGKLVLMKNASKTEEEQFLTEFEKLPDDALRGAINDKSTSEEWRVALIEIMQDRLVEKQKAGVGAP